MKVADHAGLILQCPALAWRDVNWKFYAGVLSLGTTAI